jgi:putative tryptophan/tyrosine transport system substrate-binding protein
MCSSPGPTRCANEAARVLILAVGGAAAWPLVLRAQQPAVPVIGFLNGASPEKYEPFVSAFLQGLKETGYTESQNVIIEYRWADGQYARFPEMVRDLIRRQVAVIAVNTPAARRDRCDLDVWRTSGQTIWPIA